jgi:protein TonB
METSKILTADILDIIFEGRNKEYGAYELRKTYRNRLIIALVAMVLICLILFIASVIANSTKEDDSRMMVQDVQLQDIKQEEQKKPEIPPPPPPKQEPPKVEIQKFTPPKIVKDEEVKPEEEIKEIKEDVKIGTINQEGIKEDVIAPPVEQGTGVVEAPKVDVEDYDKEFKVVQIQAQFPGGNEAWRRFLERNLNNQTPTDNGAPAGKYTVTVSFLVDKEGNISEVKAENNPGYGTSEEAVRVIKRGPQWKPAIQNGRNVIFRQKQNITFIVEE